MKKLRYYFLAVDIGFIGYWIITISHLLPKELLFNDYNNEIVMAWNWSFFPLDIFISITGLGSLYFYKKRNKIWGNLALISLVLTFVPGLQAIAFWIIRGDFNLVFWLLNLFLMIYPMFFIRKFIRGSFENLERKGEKNEKYSSSFGKP